MKQLSAAHARQLLNWIAVTGDMCVTCDPHALPFLDVGAINTLCDIADMEWMPTPAQALADRALTPAE